MRKVLFICKSNINRSQQAEGFYNFLIKKNGAISAGIELEKDLQKPSEKCIKLMKEEGIDISKQKSNLLNKNMLNNVKKIVVVCPKKFLPKYVLKFKNIEFWNIKDPHYHSINGRRKIRDIIKNKVLSLK